MNDVQPDWLKNHVNVPAAGNPAWKKGGPSPNAKGRPKGVIDKRQKVSEALRDDAPAVARVVIDAALAGDMTAAGLVLSRIAPTLRAQSETVEFPFDPALPLSEQLAQVAVAVASGRVSPDTGQQISAMLSNNRGRRPTHPG